MKLSQLLSQDMYLPPEWDREFNHLVSDSRDVSKGDLFIARSGTADHGEKFIEDAIVSGVAAVLAEGEQGFRCAENGVPVFYLPQLRQQLPVWLNRRYCAAGDVRLIGVTGTNGKSSVTQYCAQLLELKGIQCGVIGTLGNGLWPHLQPTRNTTPDICLTYRLLNEVAQAGADIAAIEVSSHGLDQGRVEGLKFSVSVLTNISQDHLDYHGDMATYVAAKSRLFDPELSNIAVINTDDEYGEKLLQTALTGSKISTGSSPAAQVQYSSVEFTGLGMKASVRSPWGESELNLALMGEFNIANVTSALAALAALGYEFSSLAESAGKLRPVDGRMELYLAEGQPAVVIDFAHTPDALVNVVGALKNSGAFLSVVFGCGGERDRKKRPLMADAVAIADAVWVTDDNPRGENSDQIFADIRQSAASENYKFEHDRAVAIRSAIAATPTTGLVLIAGKGHETYQEIAGIRHSYSDAQTVCSLGYRRAGGDYAA